MTNWRELGYVPNSDDEDISDGELSTQEDVNLEQQELENGPAIEDEIAESLLKGEMEVEGLKDRTDVGHVASQHIEEDAIMNDAADEVYVDMVQTPKPSQTTNSGLGTSGLGTSVLSLSDQPKGLGKQLDEAASEKGRNNADVPESGINNQPNKPDPQPRVEEACRADREISVLDLSNIEDEVEGIDDFQGGDGARVENEGFRPSPDPITGEEQELSLNRNQGCVIPFGGVRGPSTPRRDDFRQPGQMVDSSSMIDSSPLSSPPSIGSAPSPSSSVPQSIATLTGGFRIVIPPREDRHEQRAAPVRSFRERKPIQVNPYLLEDQRYRQTLKSRGIKPVKINEVEVEVERIHVGDNDSQEAEYVAPPESNGQPIRRVPRAGEGMLSGGNNADGELPARTNFVRERPLSNGSAPTEAKRRKVAHTYSEQHSVRKVNETPRDVQRKENTWPSLVVQTTTSSDTYDLPLDSPPQRSRTPLAQTNLNQPTRSSTEGNLNSIRNLTEGPREKRRGLLAVLDSESESDPEPSEANRRTRPISLVSDQERPLTITILSSSSTSSPSYASSEVGDEDDEGDEEDESQVIAKFQHKTNGVLPASWWKLDKSKQMSGGNENRRGQSPSRNGALRPGVAKAKISTRARTPEGVFLLGDESDSSSNESVMSSAAAKKGSGRRDKQTREWIDLDDIIEDDKIDRMLPATSRRRENTQAKRKKRASNAQSFGRDIMVSSGRGQNFTSRSGPAHLRQPKITDHVSSKKRITRWEKPAAPRVGIVDAVQHYRATTTVSPPNFIKLAARVARERRDQGRQSPSRKLFVLETKTDTRDVQEVIRDWERGALSFVEGRDHGGSFHDSGLGRGGGQGSGLSRHQLRLPSPQRLSELQGHSFGWKSGLSPAVKPPQPKKQGGRQTTLSNIIRKEPKSKKITPIRPRPKTQLSTVTTLLGRSSFATHRPNFTPQPVQFEVQAPFNNTLRRVHQYARRAPTPDVTALLHYTARKNLHLARFMEDEDLVRPMPLPSLVAHNPPNVARAPLLEQPKLPKPSPRARRKRTPRRIDADTVERRQPPPQDATIEDFDLHTPPEVLPRDSKPVLQGLLPYGSKYSLNFDMTPLNPGTIFNSETFIGDGGLSKALNTPPAKSTRGNQGSSFTFGDKIVNWGVYGDSVAADFEIIMNQIADATEKAHEKDELNGADFHCLTSQVYPFYIFFSNYLAQIISFPDSIDIVSFGQRVLQAIEVCCDRVVAALGGSDTHSNPRNSSTRLKLQLLTFSLVFSLQIYQLASEDSQVRARLEVEKIIQKSGLQLLRQLMKCGLGVVRECYEDQRQRSKYERGICREHYVVEIWVIAIKVLGQVGSPDISLWQFFNSELRAANLENTLDVRLFEKHWSMVFSILPLFQFDTLGFIQPPPKEYHSSENWALLKTLISRPLRVYNTNPEAHSGTIIDYCRVLYARCHHLINSWGWANPDIIIPTLYEFFASNNLANLKNENEYGSAEFLQNLEKIPSLAVRDSDRCFHLLLKIVAIGINSMKVTSTARKIGNLVNRLMPNHRRQYPKEEGLRIEHLTALKNHHDLLTTLYWVAPSNCRPHLDAIRNLVDPELSHRRACNVSIRTWFNLLRFQLHSGEDTKTLGPFMEWFDDLVIQTLSQHHAARSEAEKHFKAARDKGDTDLSEGLLESNIRRNQTELEGILNDAVKSLATALSGIGGQVESAITIFTKVSTANILNSYNRLSHKLITEVLQLVQQYVFVCKTQDSPASPNVQNTDEDSQDYGDWSGFEDLVIQDQKRPAAEHLLIVVYDPLHRMLSNCFGADKQPEESLLVKVVDTWTLVIGFLVQNGLKTWSTYLDSYSSESWPSLRYTEQTRKFTAYFMPKVIQSRVDIYEANKTIFISFWLKTLVERESMLKFQNEYTSTLLNLDPQNHMFANLPFARDESSGDFNITQTDFRLRRLSLISTVLANMREFHELAHYDSPQSAASIKHQYSEMLMGMMQSMKENYQELQTKSASGAYVEFVQQVVEYLQQHSTDLINIDRFFTDSTAFPLPTTDPTYVVGRLKNYGLKLHYPRTHKALFSFFQSLCERAAVDGQQEYLVSQLTTALSGNFEDGDLAKPTIRAFFLGAIFPVYVECSFREPCGWILAIPILKAAEQLILTMREDIDSTLYGCVQSVLSMLTSLLEGMRLAINFLTTNPPEAMSPSALGTLIFIVTTVARAIPIIDWLSASRDLEDKFAEVAYDCACYLIRYSGYIRDLIDNCESELPVDIRMNQNFQGPYESARADCAATLNTAISKEWTSYRGSWYIMRGASRKEIHPPLLSGEHGGLEALKRSFKAAVENLLEVACRTEMFEAAGRSVDIGIWDFEARGKPYKDGVRGRKQHRKALRMLENLFC